MYKYNNLKFRREELEQFFDYVSNNEETLSFSKFVTKVDDNGDIINAFVLWLNTGNSRQTRDKGHFIQVVENVKSTQ